jgi:hypothetical protein
MDTKDILNKLNSIISKLEDKGFFTEAEKLQKEFEKLSKKAKEKFIDPPAKAILDKLSHDEDKNPAHQIKDELADRTIQDTLGAKGPLRMPSGKPTFMKGVKGFGIGWLSSLGVDAIFDYFEDSEGPYKKYEAHKKDIFDALDIIEELTPNNSKVHFKIKDLQSEINKGSELFENAKREVKASTANYRVVYNSKMNKIAVRGNLKDTLPTYLREFIQGAIAGGTVGGLFGGLAGIVPSGLVGGLGNIATQGAEDLWYASISDSGKAYLQGKDVMLKSYKLYTCLKDLDLKQAEKIYKTSTELEDILESINLDNKEKSAIENLIQKFEQKSGVIFDQVKKDVLGKSTGMASSNILDKVDKVIEPNKILNPDNLDYGPDSEGKIRII